MTAYCGTELVKVLSQVKHTQLNFSSDALYGSFLAGTLIPQTQKLMDNYCNHGFGSYSGTFVVDGTGKCVIVVPPQYAPLISVSSVVLDGVDVVADTKVYDNYIVYDDGIYTYDEQNVTIVASYGYVSVPDDAAFVCGQLCAGALREMIRSEMVPDLIVPALESGGAGLAAIVMSPRIFTDELKSMLNKYTYSQTEVG